MGELNDQLLSLDFDACNVGGDEAPIVAANAKRGTDKQEAPVWV